LYLGLDLEWFPRKEKCLHYPVIRTEKMQSDALQKAFLLWAEFTHVIFTSKMAVRYWEDKCPWLGKTVIAIGESTGKELQERGVRPFVAKVETQEGVLSLLDEMDLRSAYLFLPRSKRSRPVLTQYLEDKQIRYFALDLYDTVFQKIDPPPLLDEIDEIVFTSPSTVDAFLQIYGSLPKGKKLTTIGPITQRRVEENVEAHHTGWGV